MISAKKRFEILKRDGFKCQYCGKTWKDVTLEVDHIIAKSKGGTDDVDNLITCCRECNMWKGARPLESPELWKSKFEDVQKDIIKMFTKEWNSARLGTIQRWTYILLCKLVSMLLESKEGMYNNYKKVYWKYPKTEEEMMKKFYEDEKFCDKQLFDLSIAGGEKILQLIDEVCNDEHWTWWKESSDEWEGDYRLNYLISRTLIQQQWPADEFWKFENISKQTWLYYFVRKLTYNKDRIENRFNWEL